nr:MAG TPA: hypothetical protein [Caudoviricetes sp.]
MWQFVQGFYFALTMMWHTSRHCLLTGCSRVG